MSPALCARCDYRATADHAAVSPLVSQKLWTPRRRSVFICVVKSCHAKMLVLLRYAMGKFSCYIVNAVILVSKNVMTGNDFREELPRWLLGRTKGEKS